MRDFILLGMIDATTFTELMLLSLDFPPLLCGYTISIAFKCVTYKFLIALLFDCYGG